MTLRQLAQKIRQIITGRREPSAPKPGDIMTMLDGTLVRVVRVEGCVVTVRRLW